MVGFLHRERWACCDCLVPDGKALYSDILWDLLLEKRLLLLQKVECKLSSSQGPARGLLLPTGSLWGAARHWISASISTPWFPAGMRLLISIYTRLKAVPRKGGRFCSANRAVTRCQTRPQESRIPRGSWQREGNETNSMFLFLKEICCCLCWEAERRAFF